MSLNRNIATFCPTIKNFVIKSQILQSGDFLTQNSENVCYKIVNLVKLQQWWGGGSGPTRENWPMFGG